MKIRTHERKIQILEQLAINAGAYFSFNLSKDLIPGIIYEVVDGKVINTNALTGLPENAKLSDYLAFWGNRMEDEDRADYFAFFDRENWLAAWERGETHLCHTYWTETAALSPMLAEQHVHLYEDEETGEILGVTYIVDLTERRKEEAYRRELEAYKIELENELERSADTLNVERRYLDVLARKYILVYFLDVGSDTGEVLKLDSHANVQQMTGMYPGARFCFSRHIHDFAESFVNDGKDAFERMLSAEYITAQLEKTPRFSFRYGGIPNLSGNRHFEVRVERVNPDVFDGQVIVVSEEIDDVVSAEQKHQEELDTERKYLDVLTRDYTAVYHVNLHKNTSTLIKADTNLSRRGAVQRSMRKVRNYKESIRTYCEKNVVPDLRADFMRNMSPQNILMELKRASRFVYRYRTIQRDGGWEYYEMHALPMREDPKNGSVLIAFYHIDDLVTAEQRRQIDQEERIKREQNQNEVLQALGRNYHAIFEINLQNDVCTEISCREEIRYFYDEKNTSSRRMMDFLCDNIVAERHVKQMRRFFDLDSLADRLAHREYIEIECITRAGNWHRAKFIVKRRDEAGKATHVLYVTQIIDDEKLYEETLIARAEYANDANRAKTEFVSKVAHDIRTPMNSIFGFLEIAEANLDNREKLLYSLEKIRLSGEFLKALADDVLDISRMEHGKMKLQPAEISISRMLEDFADSSRHAKTNKKQNLSFNFHDMLYDRIVVDPLRLRQIYSNVFSNAVKYTPDGGNIDFDVCQEEIPGSSCVRLITTIRDTGIGISQDLMKKMFFKFERGTDTRINQVSGYGLGLSIVKQLVDLMGGTIDVQSKLGEGTTFCIKLDLPFAQSHLEAASAAQGNMPACAGMHLLVAEDNELNREVITELLAIHGMSCDCVEDGALCVKQFCAAADSYDAILMDMQMPNMNGIEAARKLRALPLSEAKTVPIIAMTANALQDDIQKCMEAGMNLHLSKPVDMLELVKVLSEFKRIALE